MQTMYPGYLLGFCSRPLTSSSQFDFAEKEIRDKLFTPYLNGLKKNGSRDYQNLFQPEFYQLWGKYDIVAVAEVDDFEFATRFFRSYNPIALGNHENPQELVNFDYKVSMAIAPICSTKKSQKKLPYLAICQIKINSSFLIGNGRTIIDPIKGLLEKIITEQTSDGICEYKICESHSYHELILIINSNSLYSLKKVLLNCRKVNFAQLKEVCSEKQQEQILSNSLFKSCFLPKTNHLPTNHLFESTQTTFGIHTHFIQKNKFGNTDSFELPIEGEEILAISRWNLKPGHHTAVLKKLEFSDTNKNWYILGGKGDLIIEQTLIVENKENYKQLCFPDNFFKNNPELSSHVIDTFTSISIDPKSRYDIDLDGDIDWITHNDVHSKFASFLIQSENIRKLNNQMRALLMPKVLSEKVMKIISNYNNAVLNPDMFSSYVELLPYINDKLINTIEYYYDIMDKSYYSAEKLYKTLNQICQNIESAIQNRFYQSYWTSDVQEFNMDYSGGVHNLISAYDGSFKALSDAFKSKEEFNTFIFVRSDREVNTGSGDLKMNYLHLIQPLGYCSVVTHECSSFALEKWYGSYERESENDPKWSQFGDRIINQFKRAGIEFPWKYKTVNKEREYNIQKLISPNSISTNYLKEISSNLKNPDVYTFLNEVALRYYITSRINLTFGFGNDINFYNEVHWNYFLQSTEIYRSANKIESVPFITISIRLGLLKFSVSKNHTVSKEEFYSIYPKYSILEDLKNRFSDDIYLFLKRIWSKENPILDWFQEWEDIFNSSSFKIIPELKENEVLENKISEFFESKETSINKFLLSDLTELIYAPTEPWRAYLSLIRGYLKFYRDKTTRLDRDAHTGTPIISDKNYLLHIDPIGGTFVVGQDYRKDYFIQRLKFMNLMSHLSLVYKKRYISKHFEKHTVSKKSS